MLSLEPRAGAHAAGAPRYTPDTPPIASNLGSAFAQFCRRDTAEATGDLREATVHLVEYLKADGLPPERVVIAMKDALTRYGGYHLPPSLSDAESAVGERPAMAYRRVFAWCLDAYYGAP